MGACELAGRSPLAARIKQGIRNSFMMIEKMFLEEQIDDLTNYLAEVEEELEEKRKEVASLENQIAEMKEEIEEMKSQLEAINEDEEDEEE